MQEFRSLEISKGLRSLVRVQRVYHLPPSPREPGARYQVNQAEMCRVLLEAMNGAAW